MTTSCWKEGPSERPTVDYVLAGLSSVVEQQKHKHGVFLALPPQDNMSRKHVQRYEGNGHICVASEIRDSTVLYIQ